MEKGLVHLYIGDGKGKTTAAVGLCVRAAGRGFPVVFCQFLKDGQSGECALLRALPGVTVVDGEPVNGFYPFMPPEKQQRVRECERKRFDRAAKLCLNARLLVLDEAVDAVRLGVLPIETVLEFLKNRPVGLEVVLTGREPDQRLVAMADYISDIRCVRHPYQKGAPARKGVEF